MKSRSSRHVKTSKYPFLAIHRDDEERGHEHHFRPSVLLITQPGVGVVVSEGSEYRFGENGQTWTGSDSYLIPYNGRITISNY